ncbi:MAG: glycosyltransferase [Notoacmeibacter sp.]|nr:glycosyltransferase [Notoacmeibacter sp.]
MIPRMTDDISVISKSPGLEGRAVEVVVTLPTFKRPEHLLETLQSLRRQNTARNYAVIVMENEAEAREGAGAAQPLFERGEIAGLLILAHARGNCNAYNAGWLTALVHFPALEYLLVIDDDEIAGPEWIERMCLTAEMLDADIVGGPQVPVFAEPADPRIANHPVFLPPHAESGRVDALYSSGNLLIRRKVLEKMGSPFLDPAFNFLGGGDSDFLSRSAATGFQLAWCSEAPVYETVPPRRVEADWIRARSIRNGVISTLVERRRRANEPLGRLKVIARSFALLAVSPLRGLARLAAGAPLSVSLYPVLVGIGRVAAEFGYAREQYRQPEKN